ncbi:MAG: DUF6716 putative glycosyltransferase [Pseudolysinimonas sp.]
MRVLAIADSDSYLKWAASLLAALPVEWDRELVVVETPVMPSASQRSAALSVSGIDPECVARLGLTDLPDRLRLIDPDVVLVATRGPVARVLLRVAADAAPGAVLVSGLPGISIPATRKALMFRRQADLFVLHSRREIRDFSFLAVQNGWSQRFSLATLPFVEHDQPAAGGGGDLVFAAQAIVPRDPVDRLRVARLLRDAALAEPDRRVVLKVRAVKGERQTHDEDIGYPELLQQLGRVPENLVVSSQPMSTALNTAAGLVTISSTAAVEAIVRGVPVIALDTFGVSDELINPVFVDSGLLAGEAAVIGREFRMPRADWLADNYLHGRDQDDLIETLGELIAARRSGALPARDAPVQFGGRLRLAWERRRAFGAADRSVSGALALAVGMPARAAYITARRVRGRLSRGLSSRLGEAASPEPRDRSSADRSELRVPR